MSAPEAMFGMRPVEGDPETGDTSDGGDNPTLRSRERTARGQTEQGNRRAPAETEGEGDEFGESGGSRGRHATADDGRGELSEVEDDAPSELDAEAADGQEVDEADEGEKFPVVVDGEEREASSRKPSPATFEQRHSISECPI